jgi:hypothetical protein
MSFSSAAGTGRWVCVFSITGRAGLPAIVFAAPHQIIPRHGSSGAGGGKASETGVGAPELPLAGRFRDEMVRANASTLQILDASMSQTTRQGLLVPQANSMKLAALHRMR